MTGGRPACSRLRMGVRHPIPLDPVNVVGRNPADDDLVALDDDTVAGLHCRDGEGLARAECIRPHPLDGHRRVCKELEATTTLLSVLKPEEGQVDREDLCVKALLVRSKIEAAAMPVLRLPPGEGRFHSLS